MEGNSFSESYKAAGVDVTAGYRAVELMKKHVESTRIPGVLEGIGGFGGLFAPNLGGMEEPVLVSGTDGVGTKQCIAFQLDKHDTVGIDCVAMSVNDVVCTGAAPLFFLDYLAVGKNQPERVAQIVSGVAQGCVMAGCALVGGETAEHPGMMPEEEYDLAGFAVGIVDRKKILDRQSVRPGDAIVGLASSGFHSNGFSLIRKVIADAGLTLEDWREELGMTLGEALITPTRIYVKPVLRLLESVPVRSISHITGGGFQENLPRALPEGCGAVIQRDNINIPPVIALIQRLGGIPERDMFNTFNMGIGMCIVVPQEHAADAMRILDQAGETAAVIGEVRGGVEGVQLV